MRRIIASLLSLSIFTINADARLIGINPVGDEADVVCYGGRVAGNTVKENTEVCIDAEGNIIPTSLPSQQSLGLPTTLPWQALFIGTATTLGTAAGVYIGTGLSGNMTNGTAPILSLAGRMFTSVRAGTAGPFITANTFGNSSNCGNFPVLITGSDFAGIITVGTSSAVTGIPGCSIGFGDIYLNTPICSITLISGNISLSGNGPGIAGVLNPIVYPTGIQFNTYVQAPEKISYTCVGQAQ